MKTVKEYTAFFEGIADFPKTGGPASYQLGRSINHRVDTRSIQLNPRTIKQSGTVITALPKWGITPPLSCNDTFIYDEAGNIYMRNSSSNYSFLHRVPASHGNGMQWFGEDNFIYYTSDKLIGRYGPVCGTNPTFVDDFFGSQGGIRTNTFSLSLVSGSSQYASRADTASLSITGNLSLEAQIKPTTLPTSGNTETLVSKWNENGNLRSYKFDITTVSNYFGGGGDGALTISVNTTDAPIDSACTGTSGALTLSATNASFAANQIILIHQTQGSGAGTWMRNQIQSYTAGTITLVNPLNAAYVSGAQVLVLKQYTNITINAGVTWTAKAWNGTVGGILAYLCNGTFSVAATGAITASQKGFRAGTGGLNASGTQGEGTAGAGGSVSINANGNGGGGGFGGVYFGGNGGGAGGNGTAGAKGDFYGPNKFPGEGGAAVGTADLTTMELGGGGGGGGSYYSNGVGGDGGKGGGIIFISATTFTNAGTISSDGGDGQNGVSGDYGGGGAGAGGSILLKAQTATLGTIHGIGGTGGQGLGSPPYSGGGWGGDGAVGRIHIDYYTSYSGTTTPTIDATQDPTLGTVNGWALRLQLSSNGTNVETYSAVAALQTSVWQDVSVSWNASTHTAYFYINGILIGQQIGSFSSISDNVSAFAVGAYFNGAGAASSFYNGLIDEVRVFAAIRSASDYLAGLNDQISATTLGLNAYYHFNNAYTDATANANTLTAVNTPTFSTDTPFLGATTPLNTDTSQTLSGHTYTPPVAIVEDATNELVFTPIHDPQLSIAVLIAAKGTGDWTITVHDAFNDIIATKTITNANLTTGYVTFTFDPAWRPLLGQPYHFHITSTVADGTVTTGTADDLSTVSYRSYYQFLVTDTQFHPVANMLQFMVFGNERYVATLEATIYDPNAIVLPAGWKVRSFAYWNEYLAIGAWRGESVDSFDQGRIFFWDGVALTYNFFIDVPEGAVNAMLGTKGRLFFIAGSRCRMLVYEGGAQARKIKNLVNSDNENVIDIYPGAMSMWRSLMRFGVAGSNSDTNVQEGAYTYGTVNDKYPESLSFDFPISTGNYQGSAVRIGMVTTALSKLLIGWQDNVSYGVDEVDVDNDVYPTGTIQFLIEDDEAMYHQKQAVTVTAQMEALLAGQSVTLKYKLDRNASWTSFPPQATTGAITERRVIELKGQRYREYQIALDLGTTLSTGPVPLAVSIEKDVLDTEKRVG